MNNTNTTFWKICRGVAVLLTFGSAPLTALFGHPLPGLRLSALLIGLHLLELPLAWKIGKQRRLDGRRILLYNFCFGFTWWLPLSRERTD